ncbi:protein ERGIC-53-like [Saccoglossus kowalevskii]|uniref:Protein ERGIC-53-like n=1 Tax=Saccoglossus kowalevskii TaxID=10224 RepID=A0ABM0MWX1_SACKO|nr:PREDICTED: protein ERGIC-53-like [Saccoglossus kowalevskii]
MASPVCSRIAVIVLFLAFIVIDSGAELPLKRFEYKFSFKGPHMAQKDGSVPFFEFGGSALASEDQIRVTPSLRSKRGYVWTKNVVPFPHWEVELIFRVSGRGRVGADGLAFWYRTDKGREGPVYGSTDRWNGLGVFFDSFDNDNQRNNPFILTMLNDGSKNYDHNSDGQTQQLGGCLRDFRNKPYPVRAKVEYYKNTLTLWFNNGMTESDMNYELCMRAENVILPANGYFGISAATGGLADDHDALKLLTHSLTVPASELPKPDGRITEEERQKFTREYDEYYEKLQKQKEEFRKLHPERVAGIGVEDFEDPNVRDLRLIYEGQHGIHQTIRELNRKLDEIIGRQERTLSTLSSVQSGGGTHMGGGGGGTPQMIDTIKRHEVDNVLNTQREISQSVRDIRSIVNDVQQKTGAIHLNQGQGGRAGDGLDFKLLVNELQDNLKLVKKDISYLTSKPEPRLPTCPDLPELPNCLSAGHFYFFMILQIVVILGYISYKHKQEVNAKKFF